MNRASAKNSKNPILLIGWDAAEWELLDQFRAAGLMPHFQQLCNQASRAHLASLRPSLSPLLWTSVATGKRPYAHGILSFVNYGAQGVEAVSSRDRKVPALWNILDKADLRSKIINWWPSHPVEAIKGEMVAQPFFQSKDSQGKNTIWPPENAERYTKLKEIELEFRQLHEFFPQHNEEELQQDPLVQQVAVILKRSVQQLSVALEALAPGSFDFGAVYFEALDQIKHLAIKYHPPKMEGLSEFEYLRYRNVVQAAYQWHDMILGALIKRVGANCNIMLVSDHGFEVAQARQMELADIAAAPASEHRPFGVLVTGGPDLKAEQSIFGATLLDIAPTVLHHFALPVGEDMPGRIWHEIFHRQRPSSRIPSWDPIIPSFPWQEEGPAPSTESLEDLKALGYWEAEAADQEQYIAEEQAYNKAVSLAEAHQYLSALELAEPWVKRSPKPYRWWILLGRMRLYSMESSAWLLWYEALAADWQRQVPLRFLKAMAHLQSAQLEEALHELESLEQAGVVSPVFSAEVGQALFLAGRIAEAKSQFQNALKSSGQSARAMNGLAQIAAAEGQWETFQEWANQSLNLKFFQPQLHYLWALFYSLNDKKEEARQALELCLQLAPKHNKALALKAKIEGQKSERPTIIVSGFPRSGTSMMMALLAKAGLELIIDDQRKADGHNPNGYYEYAPIQRLARGIEWPPSEGKALKVVAPLLPYLPAARNYRIIWMDRPTVEILLSQAKMKGEAQALENFPFAKGQALEAEKERLQRYLDQQAHVKWQSFALKDFFGDQPDRLAEELSAFLGHEIRPEQIRQVVDPKLRHQRIG